MTYDEALDDHEAMPMKRARSELTRHGFQSREYDGKLQGRMEYGDGSYTWDDIECTPAAVLAWLGY